MTNSAAKRARRQASTKGKVRTRSAIAEQYDEARRYLGRLLMFRDLLDRQITTQTELVSTLSSQFQQEQSSLSARTASKRKRKAK